MDVIFQDYLRYYEARMNRRKDDDAYPNSYQTEKALYELVASCDNMDALQSKSGEFRALSVKNAIALVKDQENYRKKIFDECKEFIRAKAPAAILEKIDSMTSDMDLVNMINNVMQENSIEITVDQFTNFFYADFVAMENIEVYQQASVPEEWRATIDRYAADTLADGKKLWQEHQLPDARNWKPGWTFSYELLTEDRHRRLIPVNDEELEKKISLHKTYKPS